MTESPPPPKRRLKGYVKISRTIQPRKFESSKFEIAEEFWLDEKSHDDAIAELQARLAKWFGEDH